jgi:tight adherence protein B
VAKRAQRLRRALGALVIAPALLSLLGGSAAAGSVSGAIGTGATFPHRALVLTVPARIPVSVPHLYVRENGKPVDYLSVTPVKAPAAANFGVVLVIDQSQSMAGAPLARAMAAARAIAAQKTGTQKIGVVTFDSRPSVVLPMTSDAKAIHRALAPTPWTGVGTSPLAAVMTGLRQLAYAHITNGAVILLSDGATSGATKLTARSVGAAAQAQNARVFTVGVQDRSFAPAPMRRIAQLGGGSLLPTTSMQLPGLLTRLATVVTKSYLLRYTSILSGGEHVAVTVHLDGLPRLLRTSYEAPAAASDGGTSPSSGAAPSSRAGSGSAPSGRSTVSGTSASKAPGAKSTGGAPVTSSSNSATGQTGLPAWWETLLKPSPTQQLAAPGSAPSAPSVDRSNTVKGSVPTSVQPIAGFAPRAPHHSFWSSSFAVILIAGSSALLIGIAMLVLLFRHPARRALQQRVGTFTLASPDESAIPALDAERASPFARLLTARTWWPVFAEQVDTARMKRSPLDLVKRAALFALVAAVLFWLVLGSVLPGLVLVIIAPFVLRTLVARGVRRQQRRFSEQLPSHLQDLAGAMRAGRSFVGAMSAIVESANEPMRGEFDRALSDERLGLPLEETLEAIGRRMAAKDMEQVTLIASLNRKSGSNVAEALDRVAESARDRADLAREMRSLTGQARLSAWILTGMPPVILAALTILAPAYGHPLFHTTVGLIMLFFAAGLLGAGWMVMNKIVNPES